MTPVRTGVVKTLCEALDSIPNIKSAQRFQPRPIDLGMIALPAAFVYDVLPEERSRDNRYMKSVLEMVIVVFIPLTPSDESTGNLEFSDCADVIQAEIHSVLFSGIIQANKSIVEVKETTVEREVQNEELGELTYGLRVTYMHTRGDAYSTTN